MSEFKCVLKNDSFDCVCCDEDLCQRYKDYQRGADDMEAGKQKVIDMLGNVVGIYREKMFYLMNRIDELTVKRDIDELRRLHYENMDWVKDNFLINEYYDYFNDRLKERDDV